MSKIIKCFKNSCAKQNCDVKNHQGVRQFLALDPHYYLHSCFMLLVNKQYWWQIMWVWMLLFWEEMNSFASFLGGFLKEKRLIVSP